MPSRDFLAVDWGTTNRRVYRIAADGAVLHSARDERGILAVPPGGFPAEIAGIRARHGALPLLLAGMVGSDRGWIEAPYVRAPCGLGDLAEAALRPAADILLVPGVSRLDASGRADVMRGEEVQLLGAVASGMAPPDALLCQPGTHNKWAWIEGGRIADFVTAMTGELFALLNDRSLLSAQMAGDADDMAAFDEGVAAIRDGADLLAALFEVRAATLVAGARADRSGAAYVSGLLIGSDVAARLREAGATVHLLADARLGARYARAIAAFDGTALLLDSHAAFVAGISAIWRLAQTSPLGFRGGAERQTPRPTHAPTPTPPLKGMGFDGTP